MKKTSLDRILPTTRWLAVIIIPFLIVAAVILFVWPDRTGELFAWPIKPGLSAMLLAAAYAGGIYFFASVVASRHWSQIKAGFWPVTTFAALLGIATLLHWDRFTHQSIAFIAWAGLYFTTPFLVVATWLLNRREDPGQTEPDEVLISWPWRAFFIALGVSTFVVGLALFLAPDAVIPAWPWKLTPLTARVTGSMFALPGVLGIEIAIDPRWSAARRLLESQLVSLGLMLVAVLRSRNDFGTSEAGYWITTGCVSVLVVVIAALWLKMALRNKKAIPQQETN